MWKEFQNWKAVRFHNRKQFRSLELLALYVGGFVCSSRSQVLFILTCLNSLFMFEWASQRFRRDWQFVFVKVSSCICIYIQRQGLHNIVKVLDKGQELPSTFYTRKYAFCGCEVQKMQTGQLVEIHKDGHTKGVPIIKYALQIDSHRILTLCSCTLCQASTQ